MSTDDHRLRWLTTESLPHQVHQPRACAQHEMQSRPEGRLWEAARLVRSEPRHCRWRGAQLWLRAGLQRALGRLGLGLSRDRCL